MPTDRLDYSEPSWFDEPFKGPSAAEITAQELTQFLRSKSARRQVGGDPIGKKAPRVYWHRGTEVTFFERVPHRLAASPALEARVSMFDYERPQHAGQALAEWTLNGAALPKLGSRFRVFDLKAMRWIGSGRIEADRDTIYAFLIAGLWSDFYKYENDCSGLVLVIFDDSVR